MARVHRHIIFFLFFLLLSFGLGLYVGHSEEVFNRFNKISDYDFTKIPINSCIYIRGDIIIEKDGHTFRIKKGLAGVYPEQNERSFGTDEGINNILPQWEQLVNSFLELPVDYLQKDCSGNIITKISDRHCTYEFVKVSDLKHSNQFSSYYEIERNWFYTRDCSESSYHKSYYNGNYNATKTTL